MLLATGVGAQDPPVAVALVRYEISLAEASQHLVIVRLGNSVDPTGDTRGLGRLVKEVIVATQP